MLTRFLAFLNNYKLLPSGQRALVAVSGGLDSVVLAHLFYRAGLPMGIAHVNFGLRGVASDDDEAFVRSLADEYEAAFHSIKPDTLFYAQSHGLSVQVAARDLRYDFFDKTANEFGYGAIATAHHRDDLTETMLLNLTRGTGLSGLHGIPQQRDCIIRPLLFTDRAEIQRYADEHQLRWREDSSNATDKYARNRLRHHVLPVLRELNPSLSASMAATADRLRAAELLMRQELARSWETVATESDGQILLDKTRLAALAEPAFRLGEWVRRLGFTEEQTQALVRLLPGSEALPDRIGQVFLSATHRIINDRTVFTLEPIPDDSPIPIQVPEVLTEQAPISIQLPGVGLVTMDVFDKPIDFIVPRDPTIACLDADKMGWPLILRPWQLGDRFQPLGMSGTKLVSDLLNDRKVSATERANTWILTTADGHIGWVVGYRLAQEVSLSVSTRCIFRLQLHRERPEDTA